MAEPSLDDVAPILRAARTLAVLGASPDEDRPGNYVPAYMREQGYRVLPVHPKATGELHGEPVRATLAEIDEPVDLVLVFRRSEAVAGHVAELRALGPRVVWFQLGIEDHASAAALRADGIEVVQDRCAMADHRALGLSQTGEGRV